MYFNVSLPDECRQGKAEVAASKRLEISDDTIVNLSSQDFSAPLPSVSCEVIGRPK